MGVGDYSVSSPGTIPLPASPAKCRARKFASGALLMAVLSACAMPTLEDRPRNLLTLPPGGTAPIADAAEGAATAAQGAVEPSQGPENDILLATGAPAQLDERPQPVIPADGIMRGEFAGSSLAFADADGLVCAGRLLGQGRQLARGTSVPINCSDGSAGRVQITELTAAGEARGQLQLANDRRSPVLLARSAEPE